MDTLPKTANGLEKIIAGVNRENGTSFTLDDFTFGLPTIITENSQSNTSMVLTPNEVTPYFGTVSINYNRLGIARWANSSLVYGELSKDTIYEAIDELREIFSTDLSIDDIEDGPIVKNDPLATYTQRTFTLKAKPTSVLFFGESAFISAPARTMPVYEDGVARTYYIFSKPKVLNDLSITMESFYSDSTKNLNFKFLSNLKNVKTFTVEDVRRQADGSFLFQGFFQFDWLHNGANLTNLNVYSFRMDKSGSVTDVSNSYIYDFLGSFDKFEEHPNVNFKLFTSSTYTTANGVHPSQLYKIKDGETAVRADFSPVINYVPEVIRLNKEGKIYTVSPAYQDGVAKRRIDRLLGITGALDPEFTPIIISGTNSFVNPVLDIKETASGEIFVFLNPIGSCDAMISNPLINGVKLADLTNPETSYSWNPVIKFKANGEKDATFSTTLGFVNHPAVCEDYTPIAISDVDALIPQGERICFMAYKQSPATGFKYRFPSFYDSYGNPIYSTNFAELSFVKWTKIEKIVVQSNGGFVICGQLQLLTQKSEGLVFDSVKSGYIFYTQDGSTKKAFTHSLQITDIWMDEE